MSFLYFVYYLAKNYITEIECSLFIYHIFKSVLHMLNIHIFKSVLHMWNMD